ncbi:unnamed protein product, partial [Polarella glacialis]
MVLLLRRVACQGARVAGRHRFFSDFIRPGGNVSDAQSGKLRLAFAASCMPHPDKVAKGGEDGYFACPKSRSFGVADGVGGWADNGVDPGLFARRVLCLALEDINANPDGEADLQK